MKTFILLCAAALAFNHALHAREKKVVRVGHFPNITHVQALVAHNFSREGKGWFEERLGPDVEVQWFIYNAGPGAMEAIFAKSLDLTYVGPSPAINAFSKSRGAEVRIVSGAVNGGSALVVRPELTKPEDFRGKRIASPQLGNTQDIALRAWLKRHGYKVTMLGGEVSVLPAANPDQLSLFKQRKIDGVWTVEPWVSRLEREAGGRILVEERNTVTTVLVSSVNFQKQEPALLLKFIAAHEDLTKWVQDNPDEARKRVQAELSAITRSNIPLDLIEHAWPRLDITTAVSMESLQEFVGHAMEAGFLRNVPPLDQLVTKP